MRILFSSLALLAATTALTACSSDDSAVEEPAVDKSAVDTPAVDERAANFVDAVEPCTTRPTKTAGITDGGQTLCFGTDATIRADKAPAGVGVVRMRVSAWNGPTTH